MFLHVGKNIVIPLSEMIGVIELREDSSQLNREFLKTAEDEGFVVQLCSEPVSIVLCSKHVYLSPISAKTLSKRARDMYSSELETEF